MLDEPKEWHSEGLRQPPGPPLTGGTGMSWDVSGLVFFWDGHDTLGRFPRCSCRTRGPIFQLHVLR